MNSCSRPGTVLLVKSCPAADLSQPNVKKIHELEIELDAEAVVDQGRRAMDGQPHNYDFLVEGFVNNIRLLSRKARELGQR